MNATRRNKRKPFFKFSAPLLVHVNEVQVITTRKKRSIDCYRKYMAMLFHATNQNAETEDDIEMRCAVCFL